MNHAEIEVPILYADNEICVIDKPPDIFVHPNPLDRKALDCLHLLHSQLGKFVYNVHRIDRPASGVMIFALKKRSASRLSAQFREGRIEKRYVAIVRGHVVEEVVIDKPLPRSKSGEKYPSLSSVRPLERSILNEAVGIYEEAWFSLVEVELKTGRYHQARRHLRAINHPVIGDTSHGDATQSAFVRSYTGESRLLLRAISVAIEHPVTGRRMFFSAGLPDWWMRVIESLRLTAPPSMINGVIN